MKIKSIIKRKNKTYLPYLYDGTCSVTQIKLSGILIKNKNITYWFIESLQYTCLKATKIITINDNKKVIQTLKTEFADDETKIEKMYGNNAWNIGRIVMKVSNKTKLCLIWQISFFR